MDFFLQQNEFQITNNNEYLFGLFCKLLGKNSEFNSFWM